MNQMVGKENHRPCQCTRAWEHKHHHHPVLACLDYLECNGHCAGSRQVGRSSVNTMSGLQLPQLVPSERHQKISATRGAPPQSGTLLLMATALSQLLVVVTALPQRAPRKRQKQSVAHNKHRHRAGHGSCWLWSQLSHSAHQCERPQDLQAQPPSIILRFVQRPALQQQHIRSQQLCCRSNGTALPTHQRTHHH